LNSKSAGFILVSWLSASRNRRKNGEIFQSLKAKILVDWYWAPDEPKN
jgi:hypothetical protein